MFLQISSGLGPIECSQAVKKFAYSIIDEFPGSEIVFVNEDHSGIGFKSAIVELPGDHSELIGTVQWICKSTVRPGHKRKNWFIDCSEIHVPEVLNSVKESDCTITTMHSGGHGGQNVNKVETGVRIVHDPTGITVTCTEERSQYANKQKALRRIQAFINAKNSENASKAANDAWSKHTDIVRGNPIRIYKGTEFKLVESVD